MNLLDNMAIKYNTDKSSLYHNYTEPYEFFFEKIRNDKLKILEIGVSGGCSLRVWEEYFINSSIVGIDNESNCKRVENDRIKIKIGDQTDVNFLSEVVKEYDNFDIIIDDGGHTWFQQKTSFNFLIHYVSPGGLYIIEDLCSSYFSHYGTNEKTTVDFLKDITDDIHLNGKSMCGVKELNGKKLNYFESNLESMFIYKGLCIIKKRKISLPTG